MNKTLIKLAILSSLWFSVNSFAVSYKIISTTSDRPVTYTVGPNSKETEERIKRDFYEQDRKNNPSKYRGYSDNNRFDRDNNRNYNKNSNTNKSTSLERMNSVNSPTPISESNSQSKVINTNNVSSGSSMFYNYPVGASPYSYEEGLTYNPSQFYGLPPPKKQSVDTQRQPQIYYYPTPQTPVTPKYPPMPAELRIDLNNINRLQTIIHLKDKNGMSHTTEDSQLLDLKEEYNKDKIKYDNAN